MDSLLPDIIAIVSKLGEERMGWHKEATKYLTICAVIGLLAAPVYAGLIDVGTAYNDGARTWKSTIPTYFQSAANPDLSGYVEWIVYGPGAFPFTGFTPAADELTYVYQVFSTGSDHVSSYTVPLYNAVDTGIGIGAFSDPANGVTGVAPSAMQLLALDSAHWQFAGINQGDNSEALVFCSPNKPDDYYSILVDGGATAVAGPPLPSPSSTPIPEPAVLASLLIAFAIGATATKAKRLWQY
jgi:hypothetical protein